MSNPQEKVNYSAAGNNLRNAYQTYKKTQPENSVSLKSFAAGYNAALSEIEKCEPDADALKDKRHFTKEQALKIALNTNVPFSSHDTQHVFNTAQIEEMLNLAATAAITNAPTVQREGWGIERLEEMRQQYAMNPELHATKQAYINALEYELKAKLQASNNTLCEALSSFTYIGKPGLQTMWNSTLSREEISNIIDATK